MNEPPAPPPSKPGPGLGVAIGLMVGGAFLGIVAVVLVTLPLLQLVKNAPVVTTPGSVAVHLNKGLYKVFERTGNVPPGGAAPSVLHAPTTLRAADVTVTRAGGAGVPTSDTGPDETITRNGHIYTSAVSFRVSTPGDYTVRIGGAPGEALVSRSLADAVRGRVGWVACIPIGGLLFMFGLVLLIVRITRRRKAKRG